MAVFSSLRRKLQTVILSSAQDSKGERKHLKKTINTFLSSLSSRGIQIESLRSYPWRLERGRERVNQLRRSRAAGPGRHTYKLGTWWLLKGNLVRGGMALEGEYAWKVLEMKNKLGTVQANLSPANPAARPMPGSGDPGVLLQGSVEDSCELLGVTGIAKRAAGMGVALNHSFGPLPQHSLTMLEVGAAVSTYMYVLLAACHSSSLIPHPDG